MLPRTNPSTAPFGENSSAEKVDQSLFYERVNLRDEKFGVELRLERKLANITDEDVARDMANSRVGEEPFRIAVLQHSMVSRLVEASRQRAAGRTPSPPPRLFVQPQPRRAVDDGAGTASAAPRQQIDNPIDVAMMVLKTLSGERAASCPYRALHRPPSRSLSPTHAHAHCPFRRACPLAVTKNIDFAQLLCKKALNHLYTKAKAKCGNAFTKTMVKILKPLLFATQAETMKELRPLAVKSLIRMRMGERRAALADDERASRPLRSLTHARVPALSLSLSLWPLSPAQRTGPRSCRMTSAPARARPCSTAPRTCGGSRGARPRPPRSRRCAAPATIRRARGERASARRGRAPRCPADPTLCYRMLTPNILPALPPLRRTSAAAISRDMLVALHNRSSAHDDHDDHDDRDSSGCSDAYDANSAEDESASSEQDDDEEEDSDDGADSDEYGAPARMIGRGGGGGGAGRGRRTRRAPSASGGGAQFRVVFDAVPDPACGSCDASFATTELLKAHVAKAHGGKKNLCGECGQCFGESGHLRQHIRTQHEQRLDYQCPTCQKRFGQSGHLHRHIRSMHTDQKKRKR